MEPHSPRFVLDALEPLPRSALELAYGSGMSVADIARSLERAPSEVRAALREGLLALAGATRGLGPGTPESSTSVQGA